MLSKLFIHFKIKNIVSIHHKTCMQFWNMKLSKPWHLKYLLETKQFPAVTTEVSKVRVSPSSCTNHLCMDVFHRMRCHTARSTVAPLPHKASPEATTMGCRKMPLQELPVAPLIPWFPLELLPTCAAASGTSCSLASSQLGRRQEGTANSLPRNQWHFRPWCSKAQLSLHSGALYTAQVLPAHFKF